VLSRNNRLTSGRSFARTIRKGHRVRSGSLVLHLALGGEEASGAVQVGLVVSKAIGNAVTRNQVKRRLRHLIRQRLPLLPDSAVLVVRALPDAGATSFADLGRDLDSALARVLRPRPPAESAT
jgi:ribonuclease P protein component